MPKQKPNQMPVVLTATQKLHQKVAQVNQGLPNTFSLQYKQGKLEVYSNEFDPKKKRIVKHREHTFIEGSKKEINIFLDGMNAVYIVINNHTERTKKVQEKVNPKEVKN